jgi:hypothetical protein
LLGHEEALKATGTRRTTTSAGWPFAQASNWGSKALQCGQLYQKNSTTSTLPAGALTLAGLPSLM